MHGSGTRLAGLKIILSIFWSYHRYDAIGSYLCVGLSVKQSTIDQTPIGVRDRLLCWLIQSLLTSIWLIQSLLTSIWLIQSLLTSIWLILSFWLPYDSFNPFWLPYDSFNPFWLPYDSFYPFWLPYDSFYPFWLPYDSFNPFWLPYDSFNPFWLPYDSFYPFWLMIVARDHLLCRPIQSLQPSIHFKMFCTGWPFSIFYPLSGLAGAVSASASITTSNVYSFFRMHNTNNPTTWTYILGYHIKAMFYHLCKNHLKMRAWQVVLITLS